MSKMDTNKKKTVVVTGAGTGLGLDTSIYLARQGWNVYATVRNLKTRDELDKAADENKVQLKVMELDITDANSIKETISSIVASTGGIYGLVNNGGIGLRGYFEDLEDEEIRRVFDVNVFGTMGVIRSVLPYMRAENKGRIIVITSVGGQIGSMGVSAYCSTKFAQEGFGESLFQELAPLGIQVVLVEPAIIKTQRWGTKRGNAKHAKNPSSPYYSWFCNSEKLADRLVETSRTQPVHVSETIHHALNVKKPKLRYVVGTRAALALSLNRYLPGELFKRLYFGEAIRRVTKGRGLA